MYASHASLRDDYEVSTPELDTFVETRNSTVPGGASHGRWLRWLRDRPRTRRRDRYVHYACEQAFATEFESPHSTSSSRRQGQRLQHRSENIHAEHVRLLIGDKRRRLQLKC